MTTACAVAPARPDEIEVLARLHAGCFAEPWGTEAIARLLATPGAFALTGRCGGKRSVRAGFARPQAKARS